MRREGAPARGTESHSQPTGWTQRPSPPQARGRPSPWYMVRRPVSLSGDSAELIGSRRHGVPEVSACFSWLLGYQKPREAGDLERMRSVLFSSVAQSCPTVCDPMDCSTPDLPVRHQLPEFTQTLVH